MFLLQVHPWQDTSRHPRGTQAWPVVSAKKSKAKQVGRGKQRRGVLDRPKAIEERLAEGRAERESVPLEAHGEWATPDDRPDLVGILEKQNATRVPEPVPIRHGRMIVSPFTFYRGSAAIMASDLSRSPTTGLRVQCCGDAHLSNFGVFAAPDRRAVFDPDERLTRRCRHRSTGRQAPVASFVVAARGNGHRRKAQRAAARAAAAAYRTTIAKAATMRFLDVWYRRFDVEKLIADYAPTTDKAAVKSARKALAKAQTRTSLGSLSKFAERVDGGYRIKQQPPVIVRPPETMSDEFDEVVRQGLADYARSLDPDRRLVLDHYHYEDFARKVVGVGSVGTEAMMILLMGDREDDPLFLQIKEANTSVLALYAGASEYEHQGERVVHGQRPLQAASDAFLGSPAGERRHEFYVRQLRDMKGLPRSRRCRRSASRSTAGSAARPWRGACAHRRRGKDHRLSRRRPHLRPCTRTLRHGLRRPERRRLRGVHASRGRARHRGRARRLASAAGRVCSSTFGSRPSARAVVCISPNWANCSAGSTGRR